MIPAVIILVGFFALVLVFIKLYKINSMSAIIVMVIGAFICSSCICLFSPQMHKPFSIDIIEYFVKINDDGSVTTTKKVTKTVIKDKQQPKEDAEK